MIPYLVYLLLVLFFSYKGAHNKTYRILLFLTAVLFLGLRDGVGTDFEEYKKRYDFEIYSFEIGYNYLCQLLHQYKYTSTYLFLTMSVLTYLPFFLFMERVKTKCKEKQFILLSFFLYFCTYSIICNVMRECLVAAWFLYSYFYIRDRKLIPFLIIIALGFTFHTSIILCVPLYWIANREYPVKWHIIIYIASFIFCFISIDRISGYIIPYIGEMNQWARYMESENSLSGYFSIGILADIIFYVIFFTISIRNEINKKYPIFFNLFFFSCFIFNMKVGSIIMGRVWMLFSWFIFAIIILLKQSKRGLPLINIYVTLYVIYRIIGFFQYVFSDASSMYPYRSVIHLF